MARNKPSTPIECAKTCKGGKGKGASKPRKLNVRQERFAEFVVAGMPASRAYKAAGYDTSGRVAESDASKLLRNPKVAEYIAKLRAPQTKKILMTKDDQRSICREIAIDSANHKLARLRAIELDAKLAGHFAPERIEVETGPKTLDAIAERAASVASALDRNASLRARGTSARPTTRSSLSRWNEGITG